MFGSRFNRCPVRPLLVAAFAVAMLVAAARGEEPAGEQVEFFEKKIRPVLVEHCYKCHSAQAEKLQGKLLLDSREAARQGGETGPAVVPGKPDDSLLLAALKYESFEMPPSGKLSAEVIADFEQWIKLGAADPREGSGSPAIAAAPQIDFAKGREFWSFQRPQLHELPTLSRSNPSPPAPLPQGERRGGESWPQQRIDSFVLAQQEAAGLTPAAPAERGTWLRRVTFDLVGLPPTPEEVAAFIADPAPDAHERAADRLLASPRHGERVARLWLDLARFAENQAHIVGNNSELFYPNAYLYRDWIIAAVNRDLPYDQFVRLQLAADLVEGDDSPNQAALGLLGLGPKYYGRGSLAVMADEWEDRVDIVGRGLLGLTLACARCHDHKFDPIGTEDYYALAGVFASTAMFNRPLSDDVEKKAAPEEDDDKKFEGGKGTGGEAKKPQDAMHVVREGSPTDLAIFIRGNIQSKGPVAARHFPRVLSGSEPAHFSSGSGRRELAEAIASPENPLTARVIVNRLWGMYFGRPLVCTPSNFGAMGDLPTHPELLDDLAVRLVEQGWSLKWLAREIVLSAAYRQSSVTSPAALAADPENRLLGRMNRRRLSVEQWRDAMLAATGVLESSLGGPSLDPQDPSQHRRTVYSHASRLELNRMLAMFDYPDPNVHADRRVETTTPLQKMFVLNSPFMIAQSAALADHLAAEFPAGDDAAKIAQTNAQRIDRAYQLLYARGPSDAERKLGLAYLQAGSTADGTRSVPATGERWRQYAHVLLAASELMYLD